MNDCISSLRTSSRLKPSGIYCLTSDNLRISHSKQIELLCFHGVKLIQLRSKTLGYEDLVRETKISVEICNAYGVDLIVIDTAHGHSEKVLKILSSILPCLQIQACSCFVTSS